jgi:3-methyladenine DNA glycosylase/8-oxoguanine DNA glycosylase
VLSDADLTAVGVTGKRARAIQDLARGVSQGEILLDGSLTPDELEERMTTIPGVGPWTAQYVAMRLGEPDAFPASDLYLRQHANFADAWRPWRSYAAMYIWKTSNQKSPLPYGRGSV